MDWNGFERKAAGAPSRELVRELLSKLSHLTSTNGTIADPFCKFLQVVKHCVKMSSVFCRSYVASKIYAK